MPLLALTAVAATNAVDARFDGPVTRDVSEASSERIGPRIFGGVQFHI